MPTLDMTGMTGAPAVRELDITLERNSRPTARQTYDDTGQVVEYGRHLYRASGCRVQSSLVV